MNDFKKNFRPGGARQGGFSRPSFGNSRRPEGRSFGGSSESFKTNCSKCNDVCEVPFRPNGKKPVFCKNCFVRDDSRDTRSSNSYDRRSTPERSPARQTEDPRIGMIQRDIATLNGKLDMLLQKLESSVYASIISASVEKEAAPMKKVVVKKTATKKAAPKKVTKKK